MADCRLVISVQTRPHIWGYERKCWCGGPQEPCACGECGMLTIHRDVEARPDVQERMACFGEQLRYRNR